MGLTLVSEVKKRFWRDFPTVFDWEYDWEFVRVCSEEVSFGKAQQDGTGEHNAFRRNTLFAPGQRLTVIFHLITQIPVCRDVEYTHLR